MGLHLMRENTEKTDENPDFAHGLYVCEKPGIEFVGAKTAGAGIGLIGAQLFMMIFLVPLIGFLVLRNLMGVPASVAGVIAGIVGVGVVMGGSVLLLKINSVRGKRGMHLTNESDSRYRVRVVIPKRRQTGVVLRWVELAIEGTAKDRHAVSEEALDMVRGGFEPMIVRSWFGLARDRAYWWTFGVMSLVVGVVFVYGLTLLFGGWNGLWDVMSFFGYPTVGLAMVGGVVAAELMWPMYVRLVPGQLDIFRYGFLGSGKPRVESFDLHKIGVCVDFGGYTVALEPERPAGEPLPALVQSKRWPYGQAFPEGYKPKYFVAIAMPNRHKFAQRLVQAARTDEPTPPVSMDRLGE